MKKLSNTETELKISVAYKNSVYLMTHLYFPVQFNGNFFHLELPLSRTKFLVPCEFEVE